MTHKELIQSVSKQATKLSGQTINCQVVMDVLDALRDVVYDRIALEDIKLFDSLTLTSVYKEPTLWRHPLTGEYIELPEKYVPRAKFGEAYKKALNKGLNE